MGQRSCCDSLYRRPDGELSVPEAGGPALPPQLLTPTAAERRIAQRRRLDPCGPFVESG